MINPSDPEICAEILALYQPPKEKRKFTDGLLHPSPQVKQYKDKNTDKIESLIKALEENTHRLDVAFNLDSYYACLNLASLYFIKREYQRAAVVFHQALQYPLINQRHETDHLVALPCMLCGISLELNQDYEQAISVYKLGMDNSIGTTKKRIKDYENAIVRCQNAIESKNLEYQSPPLNDSYGNDITALDAISHFELSSLYESLGFDKDPSELSVKEFTEICYQGIEKHDWWRFWVDGLQQQSDKSSWGWLGWEETEYHSNDAMQNVYQYLLGHLNTSISEETIKTIHFFATSSVENLSGSQNQRSAELIPGEYRKSFIQFGVVLGRNASPSGIQQLKNHVDGNRHYALKFQGLTETGALHYRYCSDPVDDDAFHKEITQALDTYKASIEQESLTMRDKLKIILHCVKTLELIHPFRDANCRSFYALLNLMLLQNHLPPTVLEDPNRLDGYTEEELVDEVIQGMLNFAHIKKHGTYPISPNTSMIAKHIIEQSQEKKSTKKLLQRDFINAIYQNNIQLIRLYINNGYDLTQVDTFGNNALHIAAFLGRQSIVELILHENPSLIDTQNKFLATPLYLSCYNSHDEISDFLRKNNADTNLKTCIGQKPLAIDEKCVDPLSMEGEYPIIVFSNSQNIIRAMKEISSIMSDTNFTLLSLEAFSNIFMLLLENKNKILHPEIFYNRLCQHLANYMQSHSDPYVYPNDVFTLHQNLSSIAQDSSAFIDKKLVGDLLHQLKFIAISRNASLPIDKFIEFLQKLFSETPETQQSIKNSIKKAYALNPKAINDYFFTYDWINKINEVLSLHPSLKPFILEVLVKELILKKSNVYSNHINTLFSLYPKSCEQIALLKNEQVLAHLLHDISDLNLILKNSKHKTKIFIFEQLINHPSHLETIIKFSQDLISIFEIFNEPQQKHKIINVVLNCPTLLNTLLHTKHGFQMLLNLAPEQQHIFINILDENPETFEKLLGGGDELLSVLELIQGNAQQKKLASMVINNLKVFMACFINFDNIEKLIAIEPSTKQTIFSLFVNQHKRFPPAFITTENLLALLDIYENTQQRMALFKAYLSSPQYLIGFLFNLDDIKVFLLRMPELSETLCDFFSQGSNRMAIIAQNIDNLTLVLSAFKHPEQRLQLFQSMCKAPTLMQQCIKTGSDLERIKQLIPDCIERFPELSVFETASNRNNVVPTESKPLASSPFSYFHLDSSRYKNENQASPDQVLTSQNLSLSNSE